MSRAKNIEEASIEIQIAWFKWEFLRRNENYQKDYAEFEARFGGWFKENGYWWSRTGPIYGREALFFLSSQIGPVATEICRRWGVSEPFDPSWTFTASGVRNENGSRVAMPFFTSSVDFKVWDLGEPDPALFPTEEQRIEEMLKGVPGKIEAETTWRHPNDRRFIHVEIDIRRTLEANIAEVERRIDLARRMYEAQVGPLPDHRQKPRIRLDQYESYLKAWALRKQGRTFEHIARELFPREMERVDRYSPAVKKARTHYKRACELIAGGYRHIVE